MEEAQHLGRARNQTLLVYLLFFLHILFGITGIIGIILCHTRRDVTRDTPYYSHSTWQIITFWTSAAGYAAAFYYVMYFGSWTIFFVTLAWTCYRIVKGFWLANSGLPIGPDKTDSA